MTRAAIIAVCIVLMGGVVIPVQAQDYVLGPDDVVNVEVGRHPEFSVMNARIAQDGKIQLPVVGEVSVAGLTIRQLTVKVAAGLHQRLVNPEVTVTLVSQRATPVFVIGSVARTSGVYDFKPGWRVTEALAAAGGLTVRPDQADAVLAHADRTEVPLDLVAIMTDSGAASNLPLQPGDVIRLSERTIPVSVVGQVLRPGQVSLRIGGTAVDAIALTGGVTPTANVTQVTVRHQDGASTQIDPFAALTRGDTTADMKLAAGDTMIVPQSTARMAVLGAVRVPGYFDMEDGTLTRVTEALARAGGLTGSLRPEMTAAVVFHTDGTSTPVDLAAILARGETDANVVLRPGDVLTVAERTIRVSVSGNVRSPGALDVPVGSEVVEAVALAGGWTERAALSQAVVRRADGSIVPVDLFPVLVQGKLEGNLRLEAGDVLHIPELTARFAVLGGVMSPGYFNLPEGGRVTVADAVAQAGGAQKRARLSQVAVLRLENGQPVRVPVDLNQVLHQGKTDQNIVIHSGDVVFVEPEKIDVDLWSLALTTVLNVGRWLVP